MADDSGPNYRTDSFHTGRDFEDGRTSRPRGGSTSQREVKWGLPEGLKVAKKPTKLDDALLGMIILMRWAAAHGWAVGR